MTTRKPGGYLTIFVCILFCIAHQLSHCAIQDIVYSGQTPRSLSKMPLLSVLRLRGGKKESNDEQGGNHGHVSMESFNDGKKRSRSESGGGVQRAEPKKILTYTPGDDMDTGKINIWDDRIEEQQVDILQTIDASKIKPTVEIRLGDGPEEKAKWRNDWYASHPLLLVHIFLSLVVSEHRHLTSPEKRKAESKLQIHLC
jgi:hypothetical protein